MSFSIFMNFNGTCKEAVSYYAKVFNQDPPSFLTYGEFNTSFDSNVQISEQGKNLIANVQLNILGTLVSFSDMPDNFEFQSGNNITLCITLDTYEEANNIYQQLAENGMIFVPLAKENPYYSLVVDQFGVSWQVSAKQ